MAAPRKLAVFGRYSQRIPLWSDCETSLRIPSRSLGGINELPRARSRVYLFQFQRDQQGGLLLAYFSGNWDSAVANFLGLFQNMANDTCTRCAMMSLLRVFQQNTIGSSTIMVDGVFYREFYRPSIFRLQSLLFEENNVKFDIRPSGSSSPSVYRYYHP